MLGLRKAAEADFGDAELRTHFGQRTGEDETAHGASDGVKKAEQKEAEVIAEVEVALGVRKGTVNGSLLLGEDIIEHLAKARKQL